MGAFENTIDAEAEAGQALRCVLFEEVARAPSGGRADDAALIEVLDSPVGPLIAVAHEHALIALEFAEDERFIEQVHRLRDRCGQALVPGSNTLLGRLRDQLRGYFNGTRQQFDLPLAYAGTSFQEKVWSTLLSIPYGETWSYRRLAHRIGDPRATRAVGMANGANPIAIVVPCHRVVNADRTLGGYGGGAWRKQRLLDVESGQRGLAF